MEFIQNSTPIFRAFFFTYQFKNLMTVSSRITMVGVYSKRKGSSILDSRMDVEYKTVDFRKKSLPKRVHL